MNRKDDLESLREAKPFIRSVLAFITYLRFSDGIIRHGESDYLGGCYVLADRFIERLEKDLGA